MAEANAPARSFAQAAATAAVEEREKSIKSLQMDALAALKIRKHCMESPDVVTGQLLGFDIGSTLEVTNCYPSLVRSGEGEDEGEFGAATEEYQMAVMKSLRDVNVDHNQVGWYASVPGGLYQNLLDKCFEYQESTKLSVCVLCDPWKAEERGGLALKAFRLSNAFMDLYRSNTFTGDKLRELNFTWADIFEEIPIRMSNSVLTSALLSDLDPKLPMAQDDLDRLHLSSTPFLESSLDSLIQSMDHLSSVHQRYQLYNKSLRSQQHQQAVWLQKRRSENAVRKAAGEEPLPEMDHNDPVFKPIPEPSRIDAYLITNQVANSSQQVNEFAGPALSKLYTMAALSGGMPV